FLRARPSDLRAGRVDQLLVQPIHHDFLVVRRIRSIQRGVRRRRCWRLPGQVVDQKQDARANGKPFHGRVFPPPENFSPAKTDSQTRGWSSVFTKTESSASLDQLANARRLPPPCSRLRTARKTSSSAR